MSLSRILAAGLMPLFSVVSAGAKSNGWGNRIGWEQLEEGRKLARATRKPLMVVIHKKTCPACRDLRHKFASNSLIPNLASDFVMVNLEFYDAPDTPEYHPDGRYIPRIIFFSPDGKPLKDVKNDDVDGPYKYTYADIGDIVANMRKVRNMLKFT